MRFKMEKFELINKLSDNEISIIKRSIESVTNENVDAILSAIVDTVNNLMPQDEKFGCPPAGDGTRKDGQPDRRCGDPNKPKASVKRKPKAESETKSETKSEPKSESKPVANKVKEAKTIYKDQDGKSYDSLEELKKGSPGSVYKREMNVDLSPDEKNTLVSKLQNPKTTTRDGKEYADYAINKNGDIIKNAVRRGDSWREDSEGLVIKGRGGEVISGYSPGRVIGRISGNRLSGAYDTGKWGGTELQNEIDSILGFSAQEFGCPPAGDGTRKDGQPDRRCGDPNKPKASVKRKPKAESKDNVDKLSKSTKDKIKKGSSKGGSSLESNEIEPMINYLKEKGFETYKDGDIYKIRKEGIGIIADISPGVVIGKKPMLRTDGTPHPTIKQNVWDESKWSFTYGYGPKGRAALDEIFSAQEFGCPPAGDGTRKDGQPDRRCGDPNKPKASVKRKPKAESKESKPEPKSEEKKSKERSWSDRVEKPTFEDPPTLEDMRKDYANELQKDLNRPMSDWSKKVVQERINDLKANPNKLDDQHIERANKIYDDVLEKETGQPYVNVDYTWDYRTGMPTEKPNPQAKRVPRYARRSSEDVSEGYPQYKIWIVWE